jgi:hypothetical protein
MNQVFCPKCGHANRPGVKFCAGCGGPLPAPRQAPSADPPPAAPPPQPPQSTYPPPPAVQYIPTPAMSVRKSRRWLWIAIAIVLLLVLSAIALIIWLPREGDVVATDITPTTESAGNEEAENIMAASDPTTLPEPTATAEATSTPVTEETIPETSQPAPPANTNLLNNGNFDQNWNVGWDRILGTNATGPQRVEVTDVGQGATEQGLHIERSGPDVLQLEQLAEVDSSRLRFSAKLKLTGSFDEDSGAEGLAALMLVYLNVDERPLGYSIWVNGNQRSSALFGTGPLPAVGNNVSRRWSGEEWQQINLDVRQEIINSLPTINPDEIEAIKVVLLAIGSENCAPDGCNVDIQAADIFLTTE